MKAVLLRKFGGVEEMYIGDAEQPQVAPKEVLVKVHATALNRADLLQRKGLYPPPPGESDIMGLEMAGEVVGSGGSVTKWKKGDRVFALLAGGGYAEYVKVHEDMLMPVPAGLEYEDAAAIAEAFLTAWQAIVWHAELKAGETILIHAGASGVGSAGIQLAKKIGAGVVVTASKSKHSFCKKLGADTCIDYKAEDFTEADFVKKNGGADVVIDFIGGPYFNKNLQVLKPDGRLVVLGLMGGVKVPEVDIAPILRKRLKIIGSTLRARSPAYKARLTQDFSDHCLVDFETGKLRPVVDRVFDWENVAAAHSFMATNQNKGKIVLKVI